MREDDRQRKQNCCFVCVNFLLHKTKFQRDINTEWKYMRAHAIQTLKITSGGKRLRCETDDLQWRMYLECVVWRTSHAPSPPVYRQADSDRRGKRFTKHMAYALYNMNNLHT